MLGIVGILLLGSLAWSAVGALVSAIGAAGSVLSAAANPAPPVTLEPAVAASPTTTDTPAAAATATVSTARGATATVATLGAPAPTAGLSPSPTVVPTAVSPAMATGTPQPQATATTVAAGRSPWILLPAPQPGATVPAGSLTLEARGRGDAPITAMRIELDGGALPVTLEQRSESTWRGFASTKVSAGEHSARAVVTDANGRSGSFRWSFTVSGGSGP
jgi:hypothetical protein